MLTEDVLIESMKIQGDDPEVRKCIHVGDAMLSIFTAIGVNNDGHLDFEEYRKTMVMLAWQLPTSQEQPSMRLMLITMES